MPGDIYLPSITVTTSSTSDKFSIFVKILLYQVSVNPFFAKYYIFGYWACFNKHLNHYVIYNYFAVL